MPETVTRKSKGASRLTPKGKRVISAASEYRLKKYETCPLACWLAVGEKMEDPGNHFMEEGKRVHKLAEAFVAKGGKMPEELARKFRSDFNALRRLEVGKTSALFPERQLALTRDHEPTEWFGKDVRWRGAVDLLVLRVHRAKLEARVIDYKYAKLWAGDTSYGRQIRNYAVFVFAHFENVDSVVGELWFLKTGDIVETRYTRDDFEQLKATMAEEYEALFSDRKFDPAPSERECGRCFYRKSNGGVCKHG